MGLILKGNNYNIKIDSNKIIGVMGKDYDRFLVSINGSNISYIGKLDSFYTNSVYEEINIYEKDDHVINNYLDKFMLNSDFLNKKISDLSSGERHLLRYLIGFIVDKNIIVIDEPFMDLDYDLKKRITYLLKDMVNNNKTVIIGSFSSDIIYSIASYVLLISDNNYFYGDITSVFTNTDILSRYNIKVPKIVQFVDLVRDKNIIIDYSTDIRDLIKDVYRNV